MTNTITLSDYDAFKGVTERISLENLSYHHFHISPVEVRMATFILYNGKLGAKMIKFRYNKVEDYIYMLASFKHQNSLDKKYTEQIFNS